MLIDVTSGDRNMMKKDEKILKYNELLTRNSAHVEWENESDTSNNRHTRNHFKIIQTITEQHSRKTRNQGTTKNSHIWHCTHTAESTNVKIQNVFNMGSNITCNKNCENRAAAALCTLETWFVSDTLHKGDNK